MSRLGTLLLALCLSTAVATEAAAKLPLKSLTSCASFPTHAEIGALLLAYQDDNPGFVERFSIGDSVQGREIWALRISASPGVEEIEPEIRIIGAIHGNECIAADTVLSIIEWMVDGYGSVPLVDDLVDGAETVLVPLVNPDGYSASPSTRENANGVDLNRNLGFGWVGSSGHPFSQPETVALRELGQDGSFALGLTYHTVASYVNAAWNYKPHHPLDEALFDEIGDAYAGTSSYDVVFGWDWYEISGDVNDWSLGTRGTFDWTIELMSDTSPQWSVHSPGVAAFMAFALTGAEGVVTDLATGDPLDARVTVEPRGEPVFTDPDLGDYHRILLPGVYSITATANGYEPMTLTGVTVPPNGTVTADFALSPGGGFAAHAINLMTMPQEITNAPYEWLGYDNETLTSDALGDADGEFYSVSPGGAITLDMGEGTPVEDGDGADLLVVSGTGSDDPIDVLVSDDQDGPFVQVGGGTGDVEADLDGSGLPEARFVRVVDTGSGPFNDAEAGYDLDAVINLSMGSDADSDADTDSDSDADTDSDSDTDTDSDSDADTDSDSDTDADSGTGMLTPGNSGCGCSPAGTPRGSRALAAAILAL
jgi:carboxypeptidase D